METLATSLQQIATYLAPPVWYKNFELWNFLVLTITACIICWYTFETKKLRIEAQRTNKYSFRPIIVAKYITSSSGTTRELKIKNVGKGPALNIEFRISQLHKNGGYTNLRDLNQNEKFNNLSADEQQSIRGISTIDLYCKANGSGFEHGIRDKFAIIFTYEDLAAFKYQTVTLIEVIAGTPVIKKSITDEYGSGSLRRLT